MKKSRSDSTLLYGLENATHDFKDSKSLGKNIFTNAFPIALAQYISLNKKQHIPCILACLQNEEITTNHRLIDWKEIIGSDPLLAKFNFEEIYDRFKKYTNIAPNKSDIVVSDENGNHTRALEVKLMVVPNSQTANRPYEEQSCELVVRPPSIEQLAFSIVDSYGEKRRTDLLDIITTALENPMDYQWSNEAWMKEKLPKIVEAVNEIVKYGIDIQTPFALTAIWRTIGQKPILEEHAFEVFVWTDMAFTQLFIDKSERDLTRETKKITRPERALIWLVSSLFDYAAQKTLNFSKHHSKITYGAQTDKAGAFAGDIMLRYLKSDEFFRPRITKKELENLMTQEAFNLLMPERRLDSAIMIQHLIDFEN